MKLGEGDQATPTGEFAEVRYFAPPGTSIQGYRLSMDGLTQTPDADSGTQGRILVTTPSSPYPATDYRGAGFVPTDAASGGKVSVTGSGLREAWLAVTATCDGPPGQYCPRVPSSDTSGVSAFAPAAFLELSSVVALRDDTSPSGSAAGDAVVSDLWVGSEPLSWSATDVGGGVYRVGVDVDGSATWLPVPGDESSCRDANPANADPFEFLLPVPCRLSTGSTGAFDTTKLANGKHVVRIFAQDAAGNETTLYGPTTKTIANDYRNRGYYAGGRFFNPRLSSPRTLNGANADDAAKLTASIVRGHRRLRRTTVAYSTRPRIAGTLHNGAGDPIGGATVFQAVRDRGGEWHLDGSIRTTSAGHYSLRAAAHHPSRDVKVVYFPFSDSHRYSESPQLGLGVRAGLTLKVSRHAVRNEQRVVFTGHLRGAVPADGVAISLQARVGSRYRTFRQLRTSAGSKGELRTVYRFTRTPRTARYHFRLRVLRQAGLPFEAGSSHTVTVVVRP